MPGLFLVATQDPAFTASAGDTARAQFALHGFGEPQALAVDGWRLWHWPAILGGPASLLRDGDDFIAIAGSFTFDGRLGQDALAAFLRDAELPLLDWSRIGGQFAAVVRRRGRSFVFTDWFSAFQLFHDAAPRLFSTSFLSATKTLPQVRFDAQGVYEFAFNVVPIGDDTVIAGLKTLGPGCVAELLPTGVRWHRERRCLPTVVRSAPLEERIGRARAVLDAVVGAHADHFGDSVNCPLSGGLDSRLLLAALRAAGSRPHVYVYGPADSEDVAIARAIGAAEGFDVEWINKFEGQTIAPDAFADQVARNFHQFDAVPTYGNLFDPGGNAAARDRRHADGALAASGGCGEIYRDFFYLPDRPLRASAVARTFFARFVRDDATALFDPQDFLDRIAGKIAAGIGRERDDRAIPRDAIEHIYPSVRCRSLFGREISLEGRYGTYLMPFLDHRVVAEAMTLPIGLKQAGRFEAMLLAAIDPALARHLSAYGHHFSGPPNRAHRFSEWSSRVRPPWLRAASYGIQRRLRPLGDEHGGLLSPDYLGRVIDLDFPAMRRFFRMDRITDAGLYRRIACLEYLAEHLGTRLALDTPPLREAA